MFTKIKEIQRWSKAERMYVEEVAIEVAFLRPDLSEVAMCTAEAQMIYDGITTVNMVIDSLDSETIEFAQETEFQKNLR